MAVNDTYHLQVRGTYLGQQYEHGLHFRQIQPIVPPPSEEQLLIDAWQTSLMEAWRNIHPSAYVLDVIRARKVCGALPLPAPVEETVALAGQRTPTGELLAPWLAVNTTERTAFAGRSYRGRFFISGGAESDINGEVLLGTAGLWANTIDGYNGALLAAFGPSGTQANWRLVVHSPTLAGPGVQCQVSSSLVTSLSRGTRLTTQKSRRA